jgi:hypothetical protein
VFHTKTYPLLHVCELYLTIEIISYLTGLPKPPLNFTGSPYSSGYVHLTWISDFNGGPEQFFILSRKEESGWKDVANITDPGEGHMGRYDPGLLNPGSEHWYRLESCNRISCSLRAVETNVTVLGKIFISLMHF